MSSLCTDQQDEERRERARARVKSENIKRNEGERERERKKWRKTRERRRMENGEWRKRRRNRKEPEGKTRKDTINFVHIVSRTCIFLSTLKRLCWFLSISTIQGEVREEENAQACAGGANSPDNELKSEKKSASLTQTTSSTQTGLLRDHPLLLAS